MTPRNFALGIVLSTSLAAWACSEANDGAGEKPAFTGDTDSSSKSSKDDDDGSKAGDKKSAGDDDDDDDAVVDGDAAPSTTTDVTKVLLNEVAPGDEWIELVNAGDTTVDLEGWKLADREKTEDKPKLDEAVTLPKGTKLAAGGYILVRGGGLDAGTCPAGGQSACLHAEFGISNKAGETLYWIAPDGVVAGTIVYPPEGAAKGQSWARVPSGDPKGTFRASEPTPGAANPSK